MRDEGEGTTGQMRMNRDGWNGMNRGKELRVQEWNSAEEKKAYRKILEMEGTHKKWGWNVKKNMDE